MDSQEDNQEQVASASSADASTSLTELERLLADQTALLDKPKAQEDRTRAVPFTTLEPEVPSQANTDGSKTGAGVGNSMTGVSSSKVRGVEPKTSQSSPTTPDLFAPIEELISANQGKDPMLGKRLAGRYEIIDMLGQGGMSIVYKARQAMVDRMVAIKTMKVQLLADDKLVKRFERELKSLSRLNHPHIVTIYDYILGENGHPYIVMDYLDGKSLAELLKEEGRLPPERARHIFAQVCSAVEHAHKNGIVHRDLKPGNIMLITQGSDPDFVKVVDFGVAKLGEDSQKLTQTGELWGSPLYMSPEQCGGFVLDARSDIYSLGIVMYQTLTGSVPFRGSNFMDTLSKQLREAPPKFVEIDPTIRILAELEQVVLKTLNKDPKDRYQAMADLKEAIEGAVPAGQQRSTSSTKRVTLITPRLPSTIKTGSPGEIIGSRGGIIAVAVAGCLVILAIALHLINSRNHATRSRTPVSVMAVPRPSIQAPSKTPPMSKAGITPSAPVQTPNTVMPSKTVSSPATVSAIEQTGISVIPSNSNDKNKPKSASTHPHNNTHSATKHNIVNKERHSTTDVPTLPDAGSLSIKPKHHLTDDERWFRWINSHNRSEDSR